MQRLFFSFIFLAICSTAFAQKGVALQRFQYVQPKMGSPFRLVFYAPDSVTANKLSVQTFALIDSMNHLFSDYEPESALNKLSRSAGGHEFVKVHPLLYQLLVQSKQSWQQSGGAFDITTGRINQLWRLARKEGRFPLKAEVKKALATKGFEKVEIDTVAQLIRLSQPGMQLDLGGIAKGYIAQMAIHFLSESGVASALADAGGDIVCSRPPPGKSGWAIGINLPQSTQQLLNKYILIQNSAVATSGDVYQYIEHRGKKYAHIVNPKTGYGVTFQRNVTVVAADGATADWLATACSILPIVKAKKLADKYNASVIITQMRHGKLKLMQNKRTLQVLNDD